MMIIPTLLTVYAAGAITCYTAHLLAACMNSSRGIRTYPDIGQAAFGRVGRVAVSILLYMELFSCCVDFMILEADNLAAVFPHAQLSIGAWHLTAKQVGRGVVPGQCLLRGIIMLCTCAAVLIPTSRLAVLFGGGGSWIPAVHTSQVLGQ